MYADGDFYRQIYHGDELPDDPNKWLDRASDELDHLTRGRLATAFPVDARAACMVRKAACAIADALYQIDQQRRAAAAQKAADGSLRGPVASVSSGRESVSYAVGAASASAHAAAAASPCAKANLIRAIAEEYISGVADANGVNLLYAGV